MYKQCSHVLPACLLRLLSQKIYVPYTFRIKSVITGFNNEVYFAVHGLLSVDSYTV